MIVCIAEKPSVARDIADVLGARNRKDGYIEGNGYQVTWTFGHLCALKEPHEYTSAWKVWTLGSLPMIPPRFGIKLISDSGIEKQFHIILITVMVLSFIGHLLLYPGLPDTIPTHWGFDGTVDGYYELQQEMMVSSGAITAEEQCPVADSVDMELMTEAGNY